MHKFTNLVPEAAGNKSKTNPFKWRHYPPDLIRRYVRWYCSYPLSDRQLARDNLKNAADPRAIDELKEK